MAISRATTAKRIGPAFITVSFLSSLLIKKPIRKSGSIISRAMRVVTL